MPPSACQVTQHQQQNCGQKSADQSESISTVYRLPLTGYSAGLIRLKALFALAGLLLALVAIPIVLASPRFAEVRKAPLSISSYKKVFASRSARALSPAPFAATWFSQGSVDPTVLTNWNSLPAGGGGSPANFTSGDTFVIQSGHSMTNASAWALTGAGNKIQITNGGTLTAGALVSCTTFQIDNGGTFVLNFSDGIANGSANDIPGSSAANRVFGASSTVEIKQWGTGLGTSPNNLPLGVSWGNLKINVGTLGGSWQQDGAVTTINGNLTIAATGGATRVFRLASSQTFTETIGGDLIITGGNLDLSSSTGVVTVNLGGNYNQSGGSITASGSVVDSFNFSGGAASTTFAFTGGTFTNGNINFSVANGKTLQLNNGFSNATSRTFTVSSGGILIAAAVFSNGTGSMSVSGEFRIVDGGTATGNQFSYSSGTLSFNTTSSFSAIPGAPYWPVVTPPTNVTVAGGGVTVISPHTISGTLTLTAGTVTGANNLTMSPGATISRAAGSLSGTPTFGAIINLTYTGSTAVTTGTEVPAGNVSLLTVNNTGGVTLGSNLSSDNTNTVGSGATFSTGAFTYTEGGGLTNSGTINVSSGGKLIQGSLFTNSGATNVAGTFQLNSGSQLPTVNALVYSSGSTLLFNNAVGDGYLLESKAWPSTNGPTNVTLNNSTGGVTLNAARTVSGNLQTGSSSSLSLGSSSQALTVSGAVTNNGTLTLSSVAGGNLNIGGNFTNAGTYTNNSRTLTFNGGSGQTWSDSTGAQNFGEVTINNSSTGVTLNSNTTVSTLTDTAGALNLNGFTLTNSGTLNVSGTLKGTGTVSGAVSVASGGAIAPGNSPGIINSGSVTFTSGSNFNAEIGGTTVGTQYDQLNVTGTVTLGNATLNLTQINSFTPSNGNTFTIINNDGNSDPVSGTFNGLAEGAIISNFLGSSLSAKISYVGGDGNDVVLTATSGNTISGTVLDSNGNPILSGRVIKLVQNGTPSATPATSDGSGIYTFTGVTLVNGDKIAVYISGSATDKGATVTFTGTSDITTLDIFAGHLVVRSDNGSPVTNADLKSAQGVSPDPDLTSIDIIDPSNVVTTPSGFGLRIWSSTTYAPGADINDGGNWINNGTFSGGSSTVTFNGTNNQTIKGNNSTTFNNLLIWNTGTDPNNAVTLDVTSGAVNTTVATLDVKAGVFDLGSGVSSTFICNGSGDVVTVRPGATWKWYGFGTLTLWGNVSNSGTINFNSHGISCPDNDDIRIRSIPDLTQQTWKGTGTFSMTDVDVRSQKVPSLPDPLVPVQILVNSGHDSGNNGGWSFTGTCSGPYTWIGGPNQDWSVPTNWSPVRVTPATSDILIFDGSVTPSPLVSNVPSESIAAMRLTNIVSVTLGPNTFASTLTIAGNSGTALDIPNGTTLTLQGSGGLTIALTGSGHECTVAGGLIFQNSGHRLTGANVGEITFAGPSGFFTASTGFTGNPFGSGQDGSVIFQSGSTGNFNDGGDPFGGPTKAVTTFNLDSIAKFRKNNAFASGRTYGHLTLGGSQNYSSSFSGDTTVLNNFVLEANSNFSLSLTPASNLIVNGNFEDQNPLTSGFDANGGTVKFEGGSALQTLKAGTGGLTFKDVLIIEDPGGKVQLLSPVVIGGQLDLSTAAALLELNGKTLQLDGTITGLGNLKGDASANLVVNGSGDLGTVRFALGGRTLSSLTLNRGFNVAMTLGTDLALTGDLTLANGTLSSGANTVSLSSGTTLHRTSGYVIGNLQKSFGNLGSFTFPLGTANAYSPLDANVTANTAGTLTATAVQGPQPNISGANALQRYWTLNGSGITANLTFHYSTVSPNDVGAASEANFRIFKYNGSFTQFTPNATGSTGPSDHYATVNGVSTFSDWTLAEPAAVNPGTVAFVSAPYTTAEGNADHDVTVTVARSGGTDGALDVTYATSAGTATAGTDYLETTSTVHWNSGETGNKTFLITVKGDSNYEANETVNITLSNPTDGASITPPSATTLTINNDDNPAASATLVVNTTDDLDNGACVVAHCSLREAINAANLLPDANTINFNIPGGDPGCTGGVCTINLTGALADLATDMTISGTGANTLIVKRNTGADYRIFTVATGKTVNISGLTITNGHPTSGGLVLGGGIYNGGTLNLTECAVSSSSASGGTSQGGGGIYNDVGATMTLTRSTVSGNSSGVVGGGVYSRGALTITNSTISGNSAGGVGGGIFSDTGSLAIINATITSNTGSSGGGLRAHNVAPTLLNTIIAGNTGTSDDPDISTFSTSITSNGFNLIQNVGAASFAPAATDITGVNPNLGALADNGGPTMTHALGVNSAALDRGSAAAGVTTDQRNLTRPVDDPNRPNAAGGDGSDIGASESQTANCPAATISPASLPNGTIGVAYSQTISASGGTAPYTFAVTSGSLPNGITLNSGGSLSGTPTAGGTSNFTVTALDANLCGATKNYSLTIDCPAISVSPSSLPNGITGNTYNHPLSASGGTGPYTFAITGGAQPTGLSLNTDGTWSGTPTSANTFNFDVTATDSISCIGTRHYTVVITSCPATLTVNHNGDSVDATPGDGICDDGAGHCTLRAAIQESNALGSCAAVTINFSLSLPNTIVAASELDVTRSVNITGPGANQLSVSGGDTSRLFVVGPGTTSISGLSITHGKSGSGAGVSTNSSATLNLIEVAVTNNASDSGGGAAGGGIYNSLGCTLNLIRSEVSGNNAGNSVGGGIYSRGAMSIVNSTISTNSAGGVGGGIFGDNGGTSLTITNSTIANNSSADSGGGLGVFGFNATLRNTIVANNTATFGNKDLHTNLGGSVTSLGHNLVRDPGGYTPDATDINNQDPKLDALANYGGPTQTHRLQAISPALDAGDNCVFDNSCAPLLASALTTDQRGTGFGRKLDANSDGVAGVDIGAVEAAACTIPPATPTASNGGPYCEGATIQLSTPSVSGATYAWTGPNGFTSADQNPTISLATTANAGTYLVTVTIGSCASAAGSTTVVVKATPATPTASNGGPYVEGATIQLSTPTVGGATYSWTGPHGFTSSLQNPTRSSSTTADAGVYSVTVTVNGCTSAAGTTNVVVNANETDVLLSGGNLVISDANGGNTNDTLTISLNGSNVRISDPNNSLSCSAGVSFDAHTCDVPLASITGNIQVDTLAGNDSLTLDLTNGNFIPAVGLSYAGGDPTTGPGDKLSITGGSQGKVTYNYANAHDGNIVMQNYGTVTYTGLEPITNSGTATDVIFNLPNAVNVATLSDLGSGNSRLESTGTFEQTDFANPTGSVTITGGILNDSIKVNALAAGYPSLTINGNQGNDSVNLNGNITLAANAKLDVNLQDDDLIPGIDNVSITGQLTTSGTGTIDIRASEKVILNSPGGLQTENGSLTVEANQQATSTATDHNGVVVNGATIQSTGAGNISIKGRGGEGAFNAMYGVYVQSGGKILSTGTGTITVQGTGGARTGGAIVGSELYGVYVYLSGSEISSSSSAIQITGQGGATNDTGGYGVVVGGGKIQTSGAGTLTINGTGGTCSGGNPGQLDSAGVAVVADNPITPTAGGVVASTGTGANAGKIVITGIGGNGGDGSSQGIRVDRPGTVTTVDGLISMDGTGGAGGNASLGISIRGDVTATGLGAINLAGTGGTSAGAFATHGVNVRNTAVVTVKDGNLTIKGSGGDGTDNAGFNLAPGGTGTLQAAGAGSIIINADRVTINPTASATINAGANTVSIVPKTANVSIDLGSTTDTTSALELSDGELDRVTAATLKIGDSVSGAITVTADITRTASTNMSLTSNSDIIISGGQVNTGGGTLLLDCGNSPAAVKPTKSSTDVTASTLSFGSDLSIVINGTTVDSQYTQLNVLGDVNLTGVDLVLSSTNSYTPVGGETFKIVNNAGSNAITGTFNGLTEGATIPNFLGSGLSAKITYVGDTGNDVVLTVQAAPAPEMDMQGGSPPVSIPDGDTSLQTADGTDFGSASVGNSINHAFTILNTGTANLNLTDAPNAVQISGANAADFTVTVQPNSPVTASGSATFTIRFTPSASGTRTATVTIANDDANENPYDFSIQGTGADPTCATPPAGMVAWYPGDGNPDDIQGPTFENGTLQNGATFTTGKVGQAFSFNDGDDQVVVPHNPNQNTGAQITLDAWIRPTTATFPDSPSIINKRTADDLQGYTFELAGSNGLQFQILPEGPRTLFVNNVLTANVWQHVAATYDGTTMRIYVDGSEVAAQPASGAIDAVSSDLVIGRNIVTGASFPGLIDEVELFNTAISDTDVKKIYEASYLGKCRAPEIDVQGNNNAVPDGSTPASAANDTDFGDVTVGNTAVHTFTIFNTGTSQLNVSAITVTGANGTEFSPGSLTPASPIPVSGSAQFTLTFAPGDTGLRTATVHISNDDSDEGDYDFAVQGNGLCATPPTPTASNDGPYCEGGTIQLSTPTVAGATYSWTGPGFTSNQQNPTRANATATDGADTYSVTVTVNGCTSAAGTTNVVVNALPGTPTAANTGPYCEGNTIQLSTSLIKFATYSWTGPNGFTSTLQNPTIANATTADAGTYSVTITVNGCPSAAPGTTDVVVNLATASFVVNDAGDDSDATIDGVCETSPGNSVCTLRAAIEEANASCLSSAINITFAIPLSDPACNSGPCTITLGGTELQITHAVNIDNSSSGEGIIVDANQGSRVFNVLGVDATISTLTITNGNSGSSGAGILNTGTLTLLNSTVAANTSGDGGAGVSNGNKGTPGTLTVIGSTINNNSATAGGGGIRNSGTLTVVNSTISGNSVTTNGGGLLNTRGGTITTINTTITNNRANTGPAHECESGPCVGGGIYSNGSTITLRNTIVAGNFNGGGSTADDVFGSLSSNSSHNLIGDGTNMTGVTNNDANQNQVGSSGSPIDPQLSPLGNYGGATETHALAFGSTARDTGDDCVLTASCSTANPPSPVTTDQRGASRPRGPNVDIGAYEFDAFVVNTADDHDDGQCQPRGDGSDCTLREAINAANDAIGNGAPSARIIFNIPTDDIGHVYYADDGVSGVSTANVTPTTEANDATLVTQNLIDPDYPHSWWTIKVNDNDDGSLPELNGNVFVDGFSQPPGPAPNTNQLSGGINAVLRIEIDGTNDPDGIGLEVCGFGGSTVQGLVINRFYGQQLWLVSDYNTIQGNFVGTDVSGTLAYFDIGGEGILLEDASYNDIGGGDPSQRNLISGNYDGIAILSSIGTETANQSSSRAPRATTARQSRAATARQTRAAAARQSRAATARQSSANQTRYQKGNSAANAQSASAVQKQSSRAQAGRLSNLAAAKTQRAKAPRFRSGITLDSFIFGSGFNNIEGNYVGTDRTGTKPLANQTGIYLIASWSNMIGCTVPEEANVISGNAYEGILVVDALSCSNLIQGNFIGTKADGSTALGNSTAGISIYDASDTVIGFDVTSNGRANVIAFNGGNGVELQTVFNDPVNNIISRNSIHDNGKLGIDLIGGTEDSSGVTQNDGDDTDTGPNQLQNYPVSLSSVASGSSATIKGTLNSQDGNYTIEFFANATCDGSGYGEGPTYLGSKQVAVSGGTVTFESDPYTLSAGDHVTATTTDAAGNTSEFSACTCVVAATPIASNDGPYCQNSTINLSTPAVAGATYSWTGPNGFASSGQNPTRSNATLADAGTYSVTVTVNGCTSSAGSTDVVIKAEPAAPTASNTGPYTEGQTIQLNASTVVGATYSWTGPNGFTSSDQNPTIPLATTANAGDYTVFVTVDGCASPTRTTTVAVNACVTIFHVNSSGDESDGTPGDGVCKDSVNKQCTLRAAVEEANALTTCGTITIDFTNGVNAITIGSQLTINHNVIIDGSTAPSLVISGNNATRLFTVNNGKTVSISTMTLTGGNGSSGDGGAIQNNGTLTLNRVTLNGNNALNGGAIRNDGNLILTNTTISGNTSNADGGGLFSAIGQATLTNVTIAYNRADNDNVGGGNGGGLSVASGNVLLHNTIVADNYQGSSPSTTAHNINGTVDPSSSYNLIGVGGGGLTNGFNNNQVGVATAFLGKLIDNGGPTFTIGLLYNSPAIDVGDDCVFNNSCTPTLGSALTNDQRGLSRKADGDLTSGAHVDIGAYERQTTEERFAPVGTNVKVDINDVRLTFPSVTNVQPQTVELTVNAVPGDCVGCSGPAFDIHPTSNFYGNPVTMCFYLPAITNLTTFNALKVYHRESGNLIDHTPNANHDFPNKLVCISDITSFSQFVISQPVTPTVANGDVSGQIVDHGGNPIEGAAVRMSGTQNRLTVTDAQGNYHFDSVETNGFYVVTPSRTNFSFSPAQRSFSQLGAHSDAVFTGTATGSALNPLDATEYFVRQQYLDFLGREPDESGFNFWVNNIDSCGTSSQCREVKRIDTSGAFFLSIEFQQTGYLVYRAYEAAYGDLDNAPVPLTSREFTPDTRAISNGVVVLQSGWQQKLEANKQAFMSEFVQRPRFTTAYPTSMSPTEFVDKLFATAHVASGDSDYAAAIALFGTATDSSDVSARARALRRLAENSTLTGRQFNRAFVLMQYFGYLKRDPNSGRDTDFSGYSFWLDKLNTFNGNFENAEMVKAFLSSTEYRDRFPR